MIGFLCAVLIVLVAIYAIDDNPSSWANRP